MLRSMLGSIPPLGRRRVGAIAPFLLVTLAGCPDTDPTVFVDARVEGAVLTVEDGALGASLSGSFSLRLHLGPRASDASSVELGSFAVLDAESGAPLLDPLPAAAGQTGPVRVEQGSTVEIPYTIDSGTSPITPAVRDALCSAQNLVIAGSVHDSLQEGPTTARSAAFVPTGCP